MNWFDKQEITRSFGADHPRQPSLTGVRKRRGPLPGAPEPGAPEPGTPFTAGCNHLLAIKQDADQVIPDAPSDAKVPKCYKPLLLGASGRRCGVG